MKQWDTRTVSLNELRSVFARRLESASESAEASVRQILERVRREGDSAVLDYTRQWDHALAQKLRVEEEEIEAACKRVRQTPLWDVLERASARIRRFHERQKQNSWASMEVPGEILGQMITPLARVGIYIPGGSVAYPSTVLMTAIPASVAGVEAVAVATPPNRETGLPPDATLAACRIAGVNEVYRMGGAQAIGALAYGTASVPAVDKIVGPGNVYVNTAKRLVYGTVGIDSLAGPSEVAALIDDSVEPETVAADIIAQCEHDPLNSALLVSPSEAILSAVLAEIERQLETLPRAEVVRKALEQHSFVVRTDSLAEAAAVVSVFAPEHLHLDVRDPWGILGSIRNAGAILIGPYTSASLGDYVAGPSHTLPTAGGARFDSPVSVDTFCKRSSVLYFSRETAQPLAEDAALLAEFEGLEAHARAARRSLPG